MKEKLFNKTLEMIAIRDTYYEVIQKGGKGWYQTKIWNSAYRDYDMKVAVLIDLILDMELLSEFTEWKKENYKKVRKGISIPDSMK